MLETGRKNLHSATNPLFAADVVALQFGDAGPAVGSQLGALGKFRLSLQHRRASSRDDSLLHIGLNVGSGDPEAGAERREARERRSQAF